ncbi:MAG: LPS-assembly protein LptD [Bacteroidetes bacterium]|nr:LPS-assembly protein LptD [Bacteroidota bacterium]MBU1113511.1 LPS-assembly protein LptD [Bacteroidota bacterium]MBU1797039.1 LPS-assembly protein LptD [Bacteroidota bacterium]
MKIFLFAILLFTIQIFAQNIDSVSTQIFSDSLFTSLSDSLGISDSLSILDSLKQKPKDEIDAIVFANAKDSLVFKVKEKEMYLYGEGDIKYKQTSLKSANIKINFETSDLEAIGREDKTDSLNTKLVETPVLVEASDTYEGTSIKYNFKTQHGFISVAKNNAENKTYYGEKVKKVDKKIFFIENGKFTTCDADTPHYYFGAEKMKVIQGQQIIAKWIFMYIGGVPFPIPLPWGVFPNKTGRASGIIAPTYGYTKTQGWYLRNMGYFYVINDYADATLTGDYYFKGSYGLRGRMRYNKRYDYTGNINGGFSNKISNEIDDLDYREAFDWNINVNHNQTINPSTQLDVSLKFMSGNYINNNSPNINDRVRQEIISNATFSKRWDESGINLSMSYSRNQNLETGDITEDLPNISLSKSRVYPFQRNGGSSKDKSWYEYIGYGYSGSFKNNRKKYDGESTIHGGLNHSVNVSASPKFGHFSLSPSLQINSKWYNKRQVKEYENVLNSTGEDSLVFISHDINDLNTVNTYSLNLSTSTKIYGMMQPQMLGISAFRHTFQPSLTYSYNPDFSTDSWGYFDSYIDTTGKLIKYDKFGNQIFGGAGSGEDQRLSLTLGNDFEIKTIKDPTDTTSESHKIKLLHLAVSSSYNFVADSVNIYPINVSFNTQIGSILKLNGSTIFSPYVFSKGEATNTFLVNSTGSLLRMRSFDLTLSSSLSADLFKSEKEKKKDKDKGPDNVESDQLGSNNKSDDYIELYKDEETDFEIPWNFDFSYNYNYSNRGVGYKSDRSNLRADLSFNLTQKWKFTFGCSYNIKDKQISAPNVTIYRDLHAWEANLAWTPIGTYTGFKFEIRLKAPEFRDIKLSKSKDIYSGF